MSEEKIIDLYKKLKYREAAISALNVLEAEGLSKDTKDTIGVINFEIESDYNDEGGSYKFINNCTIYDTNGNKISLTNGITEEELLSEYRCAINGLDQKNISWALKSFNNYLKNNEIDLDWGSMTKDYTTIDIVKALEFDPSKITIIEEN